MQRRLLASLVLLLATSLLPSCTTGPAATQAYSGARRSRAEVAVLMPQKGKGWSTTVESVDGVKITGSAEVLPGTHRVTVTGGSVGAAFNEAAATKKSGGAASFTPSGFSMTSSTGVTIDLNDPAFGAALKNQDARNRRTLSFTAEPGRTYQLICDPATGSSLRIQPVP